MESVKDKFKELGFSDDRERMLFLNKITFNNVVLMKKESPTHNYTIKTKQTCPIGTKSVTK